MSLAPTELLASHPWRKACFTTYALSLSFFEAVVLDSLVRGGSDNALILADVFGVRASLSERGAQRVGKDYNLEPVAVENGVFHPKVSVLLSADECHVLVGSGNLTFGGWGGNCEILEHLHPSFAADAILDMADFFQALGTTGRVRLAAAQHCMSIGEDLRSAVRGSRRKGDIRVLHSLSGAIADQMVTIADDLGGATRLVMAAPFWDNGASIDSLAEALGLSEVFVHSHEHGTVAANGVVFNWPRGARVRTNPVRLEVLRKDQRRLHAKAFEILCRRGRVLMSGSANGSGAALGAGGNVEACVVRIQRAFTTGWNFKRGAPLPLAIESTETDAEDVARLGVLRGVLDGNRLMVDVLTPRMSGNVTAFHVTNLGAEEIARVRLDEGGGFQITTEHVERHSWERGRLVIRVRDSLGRQAEGFVAIAGFSEIVRRAGAVARSLLALVGGSEMPADVAAILEWFYENPENLTNQPVGGGFPRETPDDDDRSELIPVSSLVFQQATANHTQHSAVGSSKKWTRFLDHILASFRERRGPIHRDDTGSQSDEHDDVADGENVEDVEPDKDEGNPDVHRAFVAFDKLFERLTAPESSARQVITAFDLTDYLCDRLRPDAERAKQWFREIVRAFLVVGIAAERRGDLAAAILRFVASGPSTEQYRWARGTLLRLQADLSQQPPTSDRARGFASVWPKRESLERGWEQIQRVRTLNEQRRALREAIRNGVPTTEYPDLPSVAPGEWPALQAAIVSATSRKRIRFVAAHEASCPDHELRLPETERQKLERTGIATATSCCHAVLVRVD